MSMRLHQSKVRVLTAFVLLSMSFYSVARAEDLLKDFKLPDLTSRPPIKIPTVIAQGIGIIQKNTITSYGTHFLIPNTGSAAHALKSDNINLDEYIGKKVQVRGDLMTGYTRDDGPRYMNVKSIIQLSY